MITLYMEEYISTFNYLKVVWTTQSALSLFSKEHLVTYVYKEVSVGVLVLLHVF